MRNPEIFGLETSRLAVCANGSRTSGDAIDSFATTLQKVTRKTSNSASAKQLEATQSNGSQTASQLGRRHRYRYTHCTIAVANEKEPSQELDELSNVGVGGGLELKFQLESKTVSPGIGGGHSSRTAHSETTEQSRRR